MRHLRIGTRGSLLAKWQAEFVRKRLFAAAGVEAEIVVIKTSGDKFANAPLTQIGGKGIFVKELEDALMDESIDVAVHSVKDIPTEIPSRLSFPAVFQREDVRDCLVSASGATLAEVIEGARKEGEHKQQAPPELLEEVFDLNESLDELREAKSSGGDLSALKESLQEAEKNFQEKLGEVDAELQVAAKEWDVALEGDAATRKKIMARLNELLNRRSYIRNLVTNVQKELL